MRRANTEVTKVKQEVTKKSRLSTSLVFTFVIFGFALVFLGCSHEPPAKIYKLHGKVISIDKLGHQLVIDHDAIPGFMDAMTMPYSVKDNTMLGQVSAGDEIEADLRVQEDKVEIVALKVLKKASPGSAPVPSTQMHVPSVGEQVPNFALTNQSNARIHIKDYRDKVLLITFFYTRCPLNDYCPRMNENFAAINKDLQKNPASYAKTHLLSISFDSKHDTPPVLRSYGAAYTERYTKEDFKHWEFASAPQNETKRLADFFGVFYEDDGDRITHSLSTAVIAPDGKISAWYPGNNWKPEEVLAAVTQSATASTSPAHDASSRPASTNSKRHS
ncbi:MAG TPA: SCO family protein [Terriglobales bacterium]|nr:SCO family protein [Terriglobales bacterium]